MRSGRFRAKSYVCNHRKIHVQENTRLLITPHFSKFEERFRYRVKQIFEKWKDKKNRLHIFVNVSQKSVTYFKKIFTVFITSVFTRVLFNFFWQYKQGIPKICFLKKLFIRVCFYAEESISIPLVSFLYTVWLSLRCEWSFNE